MAKSDNHLPKIDATLGCELLFAQPGSSDATAGTRWHRHEFWQLEVGVRGRIRWGADEQRGWLEPTGGLLVAPDTLHRFVYPESRVDWLTFKYALIGTSTVNRVWHLSGEPWFADSTEFLGRIANSRTHHNRGWRALAEGLLAGLSVAATADEAAQRPTPTLVETVRQVVSERAPREIRVREIASHVGLSEGYLSHRFKEQAGEPLKRFIDRHRYQAVEQLLQFADMPIKLIAVQCGFADLFGFSRFVKRIAGSSPRAVRNAVRDPGDRGV